MHAEDDVEAEDGGRPPEVQERTPAVAVVSEDSIETDWNRDCEHVPPRIEESVQVPEVGVAHEREEHVRRSVTEFADRTPIHLLGPKFCDQLLGDASPMRTETTAG